MTQPDNWVILKIENTNETDPTLSTIQKVFATWTGLCGVEDSWRINSGISYVEQTDTTFQFNGYSGSCYECTKGTYGPIGGYSSNVLNTLIQDAKNIGTIITILPEETDWMTQGYEYQEDIPDTELTMEDKIFDIVTDLIREDLNKEQTVEELLTLFEINIKNKQ